MSVDLAGVAMNPAEQTVTWLITLGVLESPKKTISDPDGFLQASLKDGVVLCRLLERLRPGTTDKVSAHPPFGAPRFTLHPPTFFALRTRWYVLSDKWPIRVCFVGQNRCLILCVNVNAAHAAAAGRGVQRALELLLLQATTLAVVDRIVVILNWGFTFDSSFS